MATDLIQIDAEQPLPEAIERAAAHIRRGDVIAIPTEALYDPVKQGPRAPEGWCWFGANFAVRRSVFDRIGDFVQAGAQRLQIQLDHPFELKPVEQALKQRG